MPLRNGRQLSPSRFTTRTWRAIVSLMVSLLIGGVVFIPMAVANRPSGLYPPETTSLVSQPVPRLPQPRYLEPITDPVFGTRVMRISDEAAFGESRSRLAHWYSKKSPWNADNTLLTLDWISPLVVLDAKTFRVLRRLTTTPEWVWSHTDPNVMYGVIGNEFVRIDVRDGSRTTLLQYGSSMSLGRNQGMTSYDDRYVALVVDGASWIVFDIVEGRIVAERGGMEGPYGWVTISPSGRFVAVNWWASERHSEGTAAYPLSLAEGRIEDGYYVEPTKEHSDLGVDAEGNDVLVYLDFDNGGEVRSVKLDGSNAAEPTRLYARWRPGRWGGHVSCRNTQWPGWCFVDGSREGDSYDEVFAIKLDGSKVFRRFAHEHGLANYGYEHQAMAVPNRDGTQVLWASDWDNPTGIVHAYVAGVNVGQP